MAKTKRKKRKKLFKTLPKRKNEIGLRNIVEDQCVYEKSSAINDNKFNNLLFEKEIIEIKEENAKLSVQIVEMEILLRNYEEKFVHINKQAEQISIRVSNDLVEKNKLLEESKNKLLDSLNSIKKIRDENILLEGKISYEKERNTVLERKINNIQRKYTSLSNSKLGKLTLKIWTIRKKIKGDNNANKV